LQAEVARLNTRALGHSGIEVTEVGLGCNNFGRRLDLDGTRAVLHACLDAGITFFDTADIYGGQGASEELMGQVMEGRWNEVVLATKFGMDMRDGSTARGSASYVRKAVEGSLRRLRTDTIDVYWYHEPDGVTPVAETLEALHELVQAGTVRAIGASNFSAEQLQEADDVARERGLTRFTAVQNEYSLLKREAEHDVLPLCQRLGIAFVPYFPLASGLLTGKYRRGEAAPTGTRLAEREQVGTDDQFDLVEKLARYAQERDVALVDVAIGGLLAQPAVASVIAGATKPEQVQSNAHAARWEPSEADLAELRRLLAE
jgi:aryl-alcohol dehydrogenase-like predicted oxidoreductase